MKRLKEGFINQKAIILPPVIQDEIHNNPLTKLLFITDIGYYPRAEFHYRARPEGSEQHILIYCAAGKGWVQTGTDKFKIHENDFFIIPALMPHSYGADERDPWTIYWFHFKGTVSHLFLKPEFNIIRLEPNVNRRNDRRIRLFEELYQNLSMGYSMENLEYASICLWYLLGSYSYLPQFERIRAIQASEIIEKSILYMQNHLETKVTLDDLAKSCNLSASHYSLVFKRKTSRSPLAYYNNLKIQRACQMLDFTELHIKEIAMQLNFEDQFYFSRVFRRYIGVSPAEYRRKKKG